MTHELVDVAAAVMQRPDGSFLLAQRPDGKVYSGYWEFPGGKIEVGETPAQALKRELDEELGVKAEEIYPWLTRVFSYPHATVRLHFLRVVKWLGLPRSREGQAFTWQQPHDDGVSPMLPANAPVLKALRLPSRYGITCAAELGEAVFLDRLEQALSAGLKLVQIREKSFPAGRLHGFARDVIRRCHEHGALAVVNGSEAIASETGADGLHLSADALACAARRPDVQWCGASCHNAAEIGLAEALGVDFVVLGPVQSTPSHPMALPMGWHAFASAIAGVSVPVFALGGLVPADLTTAWQCGAHGIAMMRAAWAATGSAGP